MADKHNGWNVLCANCKHPYFKHTGRSLPFSMYPNLRYGRTCEHLLDFHHTCMCPRFYSPNKENPRAL